MLDQVTNVSRMSFPKCRPSMTTTLAACSLAAWLLLVSSGSGESLWQKRSEDHAFLFYDAKARKPGDLLTILVSQDTALDRKEDRGMSKSTKANGLFDFGASASGGFAAQAADAAMNLTNSSDRQFEGAESYRSEQALNDRVTVTVIDVLPNGNLVVSGRRRVRVSGEEQDMLLTGVIRAVDIGPDNSISSRQVAELEITYATAGASQRFTRQGWLGRGVNAVWPF